MTDPVKTFAHDHEEIHRRMLAVFAERRRLAEPATAEALAGLEAAVLQLRDTLFLHFAREEEGLFPFVAETVPELAEAVAELANGHDAICGALSRIAQVLVSRGDVASLTPLFDRFEAAYAHHAAAESAMLARLDGRLTPGQATALARLVDGL